jgi:4-amino-4-deoxy-L-arabinose transferase-like glycosyltransferase
MLLAAFGVFSVIAFQLVRISLVHADNGTKIIFTYLLMISSAVFAVWFAVKYKKGLFIKIFILVFLPLIYQLIFSLNVRLLYENDLNFNFISAVRFTENGFGSPLMYQAVFPGTATYPAFLMLFMKIFGTGRMVPIALNHISVTCLCVMAYLFLRRKTGDAWALGSGLFIALHPFIIIYSATCNAEIIFGTLIFSSFLSFVKSREADSLPKRIRWIAVSAGLCGVSGIFRPLGIVFAVALLIYLFCCVREKPAVKLTSAAVFAAVLVLFGALNSLAVKEITKYDSPSGSYGWNLYVGASPTGRWNQKDADTFTAVINSAESPSQVQEYFARQAFERYREMGILGAIRHGLRKFDSWFSARYMADTASYQDPSSPFYSGDARGTYLTLITMVDLPVFIFSLFVCLWVLLRSAGGREDSLTVLVLYLLGSFILLMFLEIAFRYTVSYRIFFSLISSAGLYEITNRRKSGFLNLRENV